MAETGGSFELRIDSKDLPVGSMDQASLDRFVSDVSAALPPSLKQAFHKPIAIEFVPMAGESFGPPLCPGDPEARGGPVRKIVYGRDPGHLLPTGDHYVIQLNDGFLREIAKGPEQAITYGCGHRNLYRLAVATAIHQIAHHYDWLNVDASAEAIELRARCEINRQDPELRLFDQGKECDALLRAGSTVSGRSDFLALMGFRNESESFATLLEYFTLDPEFACRRPSVYRFLSKHFDAHPPKNCSENRQVIVSSEKPEHRRILNLDPSRVYEIHYLLADTSSEARAPLDPNHRSGDAMLRIVACSPKRAQRGPECLKDIDEHLVATYRTHVRETSIDRWKEMTSTPLPTRLFLLRFTDVIHQYTANESRKVLSYPLHLSREQIASLLDQIREEHWQSEVRHDPHLTSDGSANETLNLLRVAMPDAFISNDPAADKASDRDPFNPKALRRHLIQNQVIDPTVLSLPDAVGKFVFPALNEQAPEALGEIPDELPPWNLASGGYGIPLENEMPDQAIVTRGSR